MTPARGSYSSLPVRGDIRPVRLERPAPQPRPVNVRQLMRQTDTSPLRRAFA